MRQSSTRKTIVPFIPSNMCDLTRENHVSVLFSIEGTDVGVLFPIRGTDGIVLLSIRGTELRVSPSLEAHSSVPLIDKRTPTSISHDRRKNANVIFSSQVVRSHSHVFGWWR